MTKAELIEALKDFPDDMEVYMSFCSATNEGEPAISVERKKLTDYDNWNKEQTDYAEIDCIVIDW
jgi:hypothetical protein